MPHPIIPLFPALALSRYDLHLWCAAWRKRGYDKHICAEVRQLSPGFEKRRVEPPLFNMRFLIVTA